MTALECTFTGTHRQFLDHRSLGSEKPRGSCFLGPAVCQVLDSMTYAQTPCDHFREGAVFASSDGRETETQRGAGTYPRSPARDRQSHHEHSEVQFFLPRHNQISHPQSHGHFRPDNSSLWDCPVQWETVSSIPGRHSLDVSSARSPGGTTKNAS